MTDSELPDENATDTGPADEGADGATENDVVPPTADGDGKPLTRAQQRAALAALKKRVTGSASPVDDVGAVAKDQKSAIAAVAGRKRAELQDGTAWYHAVENFHLGVRRVTAGEDLVLDILIAQDLGALVEPGKVPPEPEPDVLPDDFHDGQYVVTGETGTIRLSADLKDLHEEGAVLFLTAAQARAIHPGVRPL